MRTRWLEANPLVEETRNQVAIKRGPIVYCLESADLPAATRLENVALRLGTRLEPVRRKLGDAQLVALRGTGIDSRRGPWRKDQLYREVEPDAPAPVTLELVPYFAWGNRGASAMSVWIPVGLQGTPAPKR